MSASRKATTATATTAATAALPTTAAVIARAIGAERPTA